MGVQWETLFARVRESLIRGDNAAAEEALKELELAARAEAEPRGPLRSLIEALFLLERYEPAVAVCQKLLALEPDDARAHEILAQIYYFEGRLPHAQHHAEQALARNPLAPLATSVLGHVKKKLAAGRA